MPQLRIEKSDITVNVLEMDNLKSAVAFVKQVEEYNCTYKFIYTTVNNITRIENTVRIHKN